MFENRDQFSSSFADFLSSRHQPSFAFIDADNVWKTFETKLREFGVTTEESYYFDFSRLFQILPHDRCYVYSAINEAGEKPVWLEQLERSNGFLLKLGTLVEKSKGKKQEGVDVKLAIDATRFAFSNVMKTATLYGADGDFIPLVEAIADSGTLASIASFNDPDKGRVAPTLRAASDRYIRMNRILVYEALSPDKSCINSRPDFIHKWKNRKPVTTNSISGIDFEIGKIGNEYVTRLSNESPLDYFGSPSLCDLEIWLKVAPFRETSFNWKLHD
jgi:uncharacterized LabA/DUF88 family protein